MTTEQDELFKLLTEFGISTANSDVNVIKLHDYISKKMKPLTTEQVRSLWNKKIANDGAYVSFSDYREIAKDIEKAHGIGEDEYAKYVTRKPLSNDY